MSQLMWAYEFYTHGPQPCIWHSCIIEDCTLLTDM